MSGLQKAKIQEIDSSEAAKPIGAPIDVQFNPTSLRVQIQNVIEGNRSSGRQVRQYIGSTSATLSMDLVFDSADDDDGSGKAVSVRKKSNALSYFVLPKQEGKKDVPPKLRFIWGEFIFDGIMEGFTEELDLFDAEGVPLRSKVQVSIKEQNPSLQFLKTGPGAASAGSPPEPGGAGKGAPGSSGAGGDRTAAALAGESLAEFSARVGLDPGAWRAIAGGLEASLSLSAGLEIDFQAGVSASAGIGASLGLEAGVSASLEASFGLEVGASASFSAGASGTASVGAGAGGGFALAAAGGVSAAIESVAIAKSAGASGAARAAFAAALPSTAAPASAAGARTAASPGASRAALPSAGGAAPAKPARPEQARPRLQSTGLPTRSAQQAAPSAPPRPRADPRATSFGFGVPLRARVTGAADERGEALAGAGKLGARGVPITRDPTVPSWVALRPAVEAGKTRGETRTSCGCSAPCHHRGGAK